MAHGALRVAIKPTVLRWARESAGWTMQESSYKLGISPETLRKWESGERQPTLSSLQVLASCFKRPLAALFLPQPPPEPAPPTDFRVLRRRTRALSKETHLGIRRAQRLQTVARELMAGVGRDPASRITKATVSADVEEVAKIERKELGIDIDEQFDWRSPHEAFETWRYGVEQRNILVFRFSLPLSDARGFSLTENEPFAVVVNSADTIHARIFTLFHEYGHLVLHQQGICVPDAIFKATDRTTKIESWCNQFAGALLVPREALLADKDFQVLANSQQISDAHLASVSRHFKVSRHVVLKRMVSLEAIGIKEYLREIKKLQSQARRVKPSEGFGLPPARRAFQERGHFFTSLVVESKNRELISFRDLSDYLGVGVKHLDHLSALLGI